MVIIRASYLRRRARAPLLLRFQQKINTARRGPRVTLQGGILVESRCLKQKRKTDFHDARPVT